MFDVLEMLRQQPKDAPALTENGVTHSYGDLLAQAARLAAAFSGNGLGPGDRVVLLKTSMRAAYVTALAGFQSGIVFLLLDQRDTRNRKQSVVAQADLSFAIVETDAAAQTAQGLGLKVIDLRRLEDQNPCPPLDTLSAPDPCWLEPTSGSTGVPKLVATPRGTLQNLILRQADAAGLAPTDRIGLFGEMWCDTLFNGMVSGAHHLAYDLRGEGTAGLDQWMRAERISALQTFVAAFRALCEACSDPLPDLRLLRLAGEVVRDTDVVAFDHLCTPGARLMNFFGSTECGFIAQHVQSHGAANPFKALPIGTPIPGTEIVLVGADNTPVPDGLTGRMRVVSHHLADGYFRNPDKTKTTYWTQADGRRVLETGDLAFRDPEGRYHVVGRADDQVKIRGYSVRFSEVEALISRHPAVQEVAVTTVTTPNGQLQLAAHLTLRVPDAATGADIKAWASSHAPTYQVPTHVMIHDALPRTDTGKVLRRALPDPRDALQHAQVLAETLSPMEQTIAKVWQATLGHSGFDAQTDFFDAGGDSLQAMSMVVALERQLSVRIGYESLIMQGATVSSLAARIEAAAQADRRVVTLKTGGTDPIFVLPVENGEFSDWLNVIGHLPADLALIGTHVRDIHKRGTYAPATAAELAAYAAETIAQTADGRPCFLAGFSAGTHLAVETVRHLLQRNQPVAGLCLVDPPVLHLEPHRKGWAIRRALSPALKQRDFATSLNRVAHLFLGRPGKELHIADEATFWRYKPAPVPLANGLLISAKDLNPHRAEKEAYWTDLLGPGLQIAEAPGDHITTMREPNARAVAQVIETWWRRTAAKAGEDQVEAIAAQ